MAVIRTKKPSDRYHRDLYRNITSAILNLKVSKEEIEKSNFVIERDPKSLITKSLVKEGKTPDFEAKVLNERINFPKFGSPIIKIVTDQT